MTFASNNLGATKPYWWIDIEGLRLRYGTLAALTDAVFDAWNPADTGANRNIKPWMQGAPNIGGQSVSIMKATCTVPRHSFSISDVGDAITALIAVSDSSQPNSILTADATAADSVICIDANGYADFGDTGTIYLDRETIIYTGRSTNASNSLTPDAVWLAGETTSACTSLIYVLDNDRTETEGFWDGAEMEMTSGAADDDTRRTIRHNFYSDEIGANVLELTEPLPALPAAGDTYTLYQPRKGIKFDTLNSGSDYWNGAVVQVTAGTGAGQSAWVMDYVDGATDDTVKVFPPFSVGLDATSRFVMTRYRLTGCTRGLYGSTAAAHLVMDDWGNMKRKLVSTRIPFLKTRRCTIYESRVGCVEADAIATHGYVTGNPLDEDGTSYRFEIEGLSALLGKKLLTSSHVGTLDKTLWGGKFRGEMIGMMGNDPTSDEPDRPVNVKVPSLRFVADDAENGFTVNYIHVTAPTDEALRGVFVDVAGNIMIDDEVIHYNDIDWGAKYFGNVFYAAMYFSSRERACISDQLLLSRDDVIAYSGCESRGLFSDLIGMKHFASRSASTFDNLAREQGLLPSNMAALLAEHAAGADVKRVIVSADASYSDFPQYTKIWFTTASAASLWEADIGESMTGGHNVDTAAVLMKVNNNGDDLTGSCEVILTSGQFAVGETITVNGETAIISFIAAPARPRNNALDVVLQLLTSTGSRGANGAYDTLPLGFGLGIDDALIDVAAIEALRDRYFTNCTVDFCIDKPVAAKEFLEKQIFPLLQVFMFGTYAGKLSMACLQTYAEAVIENAASAVTAFDTGKILTTSAINFDLPDQPLAKLDISYNKAPGGGKHLAVAEVHFDDIADWYDDKGRHVELKLDSLYNTDAQMRWAPGSEKLPPVVRRLLGVVWDRFARYPCPEVEVVLPYMELVNDIGDVVTLTDGRLPNMRTSARGMTNEFFQIVSRSPNVSRGACTFRLVQIGVHDFKYARFAPSGVIDHVHAATPGAGKKTVTLKPREYSGDGDLDINHFVAGDVVQAFTTGYADPGGAGNPWDTIDSVDAATNSFVLNTDNANFTAGCIVEYAGFANATAGQQSGRVYLADEDRTITTASAFKFQ
jgi:hypothetical protein